MMKEAGKYLHHGGAQGDQGDHHHQGQHWGHMATAGVPEYGQENLEYKSLSKRTMLLRGSCLTAIQRLQNLGTL